MEKYPFPEKYSSFSKISAQFLAKKLCTLNPGPQSALITPAS